MDVLSEVLKAVKLGGAMFYNAEFPAPWCFYSPPSPILAPYFSVDSKHVIIFHLLTEGSGYAHVEGDDRPLSLSAGDLVVFPHGDPHAMRNGPFIKPVDHAEQVKQVLSQGLKVARMGGGGEITKFICGYMTCEPHLCQVVLGGLPRILKINIRDGASGQWLEQTIRFSVDHAGEPRPGGEAVLAKLSEFLFVETLRSYIALLPQNQTGWLAGGRDPEVGKALALLHRMPAHPWTIASLGNEEEFRVPYWLNASGVISRRPPLRISPAGGFSSARNCSHPRAIVSRRSLQKLAMSRSRPSTAPSNANSASRRPDSAANRNQPAAEPLATHRRPVAAIRNDERGVRIL